MKVRKGKGYKNPDAPIAVTRKVVRMGTSFYISIPKRFIDKHQIVKGELLPVICNSVMKVIPCKEIA